MADTFRYLCPLCSTVKREDRQTVCKQCVEKHVACRNVYHRAIRRFKALSKLSMPEAFDRLLKKVEGMVK